MPALDNFQWIDLNFWKNLRNKRHWAEQHIKIGGSERSTLHKTTQYKLLFRTQVCFRRETQSRTCKITLVVSNSNFHRLVQIQPGCQILSGSWIWQYCKSWPAQHIWFNSVLIEDKIMSETFPSALFYFLAFNFFIIPSAELMKLFCKYEAVTQVFNTECLLAALISDVLVVFRYDKMLLVLQWWCLLYILYIYIIINFFVLFIIILLNTHSCCYYNITIFINIIKFFYNSIKTLKI